MAEEAVDKPIAEQAEQARKGKLKPILLIIFLVLALGAGGAYFFFGDKIMQKYFGVAPKTVQKKQEKTIGPILSLEPFLFNVSGSSSRFAKVAIGVELKDAKVLEEAKKMMPVLRDKAISILGSKGADMLMDVNSRRTIKDELYGALKTIFKEQGDITAIYITDIIIQ